MGQRSNARYAGVKDAQKMSSIEECAFDMDQRSRSNYAAVKVAAIKLRKEECV